MADFRFNTRETRARRRRLFFVTLFVIVVFVIDVVSGGAFRGAVRSVASGIWSASSSIRAGISDTGYFSSHRALAAQNAALTQQLARYQEDEGALSALQTQNDQLRALVRLAAEAPGVTAPVVSSFDASPYGTFLVGAGERDGVALHSLVLTADGFVIGEVTELHPHTALVSATLAGGAKIDALIGTTPASVEGRGGGNGRAELPRDVAIATGTPVIAPHLGGHLIGIVGHVESSEANASQTIYLSLPIDLASLRYVYLVAPRS